MSTNFRYFCFVIRLTTKVPTLSVEMISEFRMKAAQIIRPRKFEICTQKESDPPEGMVTVKLTHAALCGSDYPYFYTEFPSSSYPLPFGYPGHECCGIVYKSKNSLFREGDRVMYYPPLLDAYQEYHIAEPARLQKLPECSLPIHHLLMTQVVGCVSHAVFRIERPYNKFVAIVGQGPIGLIFTSLMKRHGALKVIAIDVLDYRLDVAKKMGADAVINPQKEDVIEKIKDLTDGMMADIVIDAYGQKSEVINKCFELARHNGQIAFFGICLEEKPRLDFNAFFRKELRMVASVGPNIMVDYPYALSMITSGAIDVSPIVTHIMPFEKIQDAFELAVERRDKVIKVVLEF